MVEAGRNIASEYSDCSDPLYSTPPSMNEWKYSNEGQ